MNKHIEQWLEQHAKEQANLLATADSIEKVMSVLEQTPASLEYVNLWSSYGVTFTASFRVNSLKEVAPLARKLAKVGIRINPGYKPESSSTGKTYYFKLPSTRLDYKGEQLFEIFTLCVKVAGQGDGANCKYVQVGEKTIPVMEWKCDDGTGSTNEADVPQEGGEKSLDV